MAEEHVVIRPFRFNWLHGGKEPLQRPPTFHLPAGWKFIKVDHQRGQETVWVWAESTTASEFGYQFKE